MAQAEFLSDLTVLPEKAQRYREEVFCREAWRDVEAVAGDGARDLLHRHGLILFKPDGIAAGIVEESLGILEGLDFEPVAGAVVRLDRHSTRWLWLYRFNVASVERVWLHDRINTAGPSLLVAVRDRRAVPGESIPAAVRLTDCKGPSRPERRRPDQLRSQLGVDDRLLNFVHTSDEPADIVRELGILLTSSGRHSLLEQIGEGDSWTDCLSRRGSLLEGRGPRDPWDAIRIEAREIEFDEPGVERQTLGDAPPAAWLDTRKKVRR